MNKISVVIRNKNEAKSIEFLLTVLNKFYKNDIDEIIVIDNCSTDNSKEIAIQNSAKFITVEKFSYGSSANLAMEISKNEIVVLMSAHVFPVSHDFFKLILDKFKNSSNQLAGLRCLHYSSDYKLYLNGISVKENLNGCGLMFACSAINKNVWKDQKFLDNIITNEDKEWTKRVVNKGYDIQFVPSIFCYDIKRNSKQNFFRFKNETIIQYQLWGKSKTIKQIFQDFFLENMGLLKGWILNAFYSFRKMIFQIKFYLNKPRKI
ncbi:Glycosyltransferase, GT2 family [Flavobacterium swingsii]|uniref:Glycosyltransferase, GT2 family n=1 Tax=Flavobacterium swingsii TaxID=498292 RepID=A0A1I0Z9Q4_9FLAO|nr:glycosyltransferase [Flavobacterium swingsii]SFB21148.1 Glycosyltransferase, GT2 family [Flavobacterium swingsii]